MIKYAISLILRRKLRTFLTSLGITISVVLLSFIIFGMQGLLNVITAELEERFAPDQIAVSNQDFSTLFGAPPSPDEEESEPVFITPKLIEDLRNEDNIEYLDYQMIVNGFQLELEGSESKPFTPAFVAGANRYKGSSVVIETISEVDLPADNEAFVGNIVTDYYGISPEEIIGKTITIEPSPSSFLSQRTSGIIGKSYKFEVVGYLDAGADRFDLGLNIDRAAEIAAEIGGFESGEEYLNTFGFDSLIVDVDDEENVEEVKSIIEDKYGLVAFTSEDILSFLGQITFILTLILSFFGFIAAVVASIGIINTMVMSIYEQTKEIGIIKAIGASNLQVLTVFLIQSGLIGLIGAVVGLVVVGISFLIFDPIIVDTIQKEGFVAESFFAFDPIIIVGIILASIFVGVIAGIYPALMASRLDPVKALRYE